MHFTDTPFANT